MKTRLTMLLWVGAALMLLTHCGGDGGTDNPVDLLIDTRGTLFEVPLATAVEADGQLVVVDVALGAVLRVDAVGDRSIVSDAETGGGPPFLFPAGIAVEPSGQLVVTDVGWGAVLRVDPVTGDRTIISDVSTGSTPTSLEPRDIAIDSFAIDLYGDMLIFDSVLLPETRRVVFEPRTIGSINLTEPMNIAVEADGGLLIADPVLQAVLRIDPETGTRSIVTGCLERPASYTTPRACPNGVIGTGPLFDLLPYIQFVAVEADGNLLISGGSPSLLRVDPVTGDRTVVAGCSEVGILPGDYEGCARYRGPIDSWPFDHPPTIGPVVVEADGQLITIDSWARSQLIRIDPVSGDRTIVMRCCPDLVGTPFIENYNYTDLAIEADGNLILTGHGLSRRVIIRVNPRTGLQILVSGGPFATDVSQSSDSSPPVEDSPPFDDDAGGGESGFKSRPFHLELGVQ